jgi:hypothetical protein
MSASLPMTARMARIADATPDISREIPHATVRNSEAAPLQDLDLATAVSQALTRAGLSHKEAAALMNLDRAHWSRQINGNDGQHISLQRLTKLPRQFWLELFHQFAPSLGIIVARPDPATVTLARALELAAEIARDLAQQQSLRRAG